jgi:biotin carboxyl carrier protein
MLRKNAYSLSSVRTQVRQLLMPEESNMRRLSIPLAALMAAGAAYSASAQDAKDRSSDVVCTVEKGGTILSLVPGGMAVKKGDLVCELDASGLNDRLLEETIAVKRAEGEYKTARLAHEAAMLAAKEYPESAYLLEKAATQREIKLAESELAQASDHVDEVQRNFEKGAVSKAQKVAAELSLQQTKFALELAQMKLNTLENVARPNTVKRLVGEVERIRALELAAKDILELRQAREQKTRRQIDACRITAPCDGRVFHATRRARPGEGTNDVPVEEGDHVRERQVVVRVVPATP